MNRPLCECCWARTASVLVLVPWVAAGETGETAEPWCARCERLLDEPLWARRPLDLPDCRWCGATGETEQGEECGACAGAGRVALVGGAA